MTSERTIDHDVIRRWAAEREGHPAVVRKSGEEPVLRIDFGDAEDGMQQLTWQEFFALFDQKELAFRHEDETADGDQSLEYSFVPRGIEDLANEDEPLADPLAELDEEDVEVLEEAISSDADDS